MPTPIILSYKTLKSDGGENPAYAEAIAKAGGQLVTLDTCEAIDQQINSAQGILLPGGADVDPTLYGEERRGNTQEPMVERDKFEMYLIEQAMQRGLPILGICRGLQVLNVKLGGTLYQDVATDMSGAMRHDWHKEGGVSLPRSKMVHEVVITPGTKLSELVGQDTVRVNSLHHQGVKDLGQGLVVTARAEDGLVESVEMPSYPKLMALQWHPEEMLDNPVWQNLFKEFVTMCK